MVNSCSSIVRFDEVADRNEADDAAVLDDGQVAARAAPS